MLATSSTRVRTRSHPAARALALAVALTIAIAASASAQTGFQASVTGTIPKPAPCPDAAFFCGTADITHHGSAAWTFTLTALTVDGTCDTYAAVVTFALADGSTLALTENGTACGPGASNLSHASANSFGHPGTVTGAWTVQTATGQFTGLTGSGTDTLHFAGAHVSGAYSAGP